MTTYTAQVPVITGTTPVYGAVTVADNFKLSDSHQFLIVKNASGSPVNVTIVVPGQTYGQNNPDIVVSVPATTGERWIGPFHADMQDPTDPLKLIDVTYSAATSVTAALVRL